MTAKNLLEKKIDKNKIETCNYLLDLYYIYNDIINRTELKHYSCEPISLLARIEDLLIYDFKLFINFSRMEKIYQNLD